MATVKHTLEEHDVVVLREPVGKWPAGTTGTVVSVYDGAMLVEVTGPGEPLDLLLTVPVEQLDVKHF